MLQNVNGILSLKELGSLFSYSFLLGLWLFGLGVLLGYLLRWWSGDQLLPVRLMSYLMPWLLIILIPALILAGMTHHKWLFITLLIPTLLITMTYAPLFVTCFKTDNVGLTPVRIMSYNVWRENRDMHAVTEVILKEQPDILLLQELKPARADRLTAALVNLYSDAKLHFIYEPKMLQGVISRYPITSLGAFPKKGQAQKVSINTPDGPITVFNIHPPKQSGWSRRYRQISALLEEEIATTEGPVILGGDFNATEQTQTYRMVNRYLGNAHREAGCGFGFTYPASMCIFKGKVLIPPLVRIDHIFYNKYFFPANARTLKESGGSDHFPVVAEFLRR